MSWVQRLLRYEVHYAALGLLCALLVAGLPAYLVLSGNRVQPVAQAGAPPVVKALAQPAPERAWPITADLRVPTGNNVLSRQLLAAEAFDDLLNTPAELDPSLCGPASALPELHSFHSAGPEAWLAPDVQTGALPSPY